MNLFNIPSTRIQKYLKASAWDEDKHPRDKDGKFRAAAGAAGAGLAAAGLAAAAGVPGIRNVPGLRRLRTAVLGARTAGARRAAERVPYPVTVSVGGGHGAHVRAETQALRSVLNSRGLAKPSAAAQRRAENRNVWSVFETQRSVRRR